MSNRTLPAGKVYFDPFAPGTETPTGERYLGNTPGFTVAVSQDKLDHFGSDTAAKEKDDSVVTSVTRSADIKTDEIDADNLAIVFLGTKATVTTTSTPVTAEHIDGVVQGRYYQIGTSATHPSGVRGVGSVVVEDDSVGPVTFVEGDDYTVDTALARIYIVPGGDITDDTNLRVDYTIAAGSREQIVSANDSIEGALRFVADNQRGPNRDMFCPKVSLTPNGNIDFKASGWQEIGFTADILKKSGLEAVYIDGRAAA